MSIQVGKSDLRIRPTNAGKLFLLDRADHKYGGLLSLSLEELKALHEKTGEILKDPGKCLDCEGNPKGCHYCWRGRVK